MAIFKHNINYLPLGQTIPSRFCIYSPSRLPSYMFHLLEFKFVWTLCLIFNNHEEKNERRLLFRTTATKFFHFGRGREWWSLWIIEELHATWLMGLFFIFFSNCGRKNHPSPKITLIDIWFFLYQCYRQKIHLVPPIYSNILPATFLCITMQVWFLIIELGAVFRFF